jgi:hypothetical protein
MMTKTVLIFGVCLAALLGLLKWAEYLFFARDLALEGTGLSMEKFLSEKLLRLVF